MCRHVVLIGGNHDYSSEFKGRVWDVSVWMRRSTKLLLEVGYLPTILVALSGTRDGIAVVAVTLLKADLEFCIGQVGAADEDR